MLLLRYVSQEINIDKTQIMCVYLLYAREESKIIADEMATHESLPINEDNAPYETVQALLSSAEILQDFREGGSIKKLKKLLRREGPAYSMLCFNAGGMLQLMAGVRTGFKCIGASDIDKVFN